MAEPHPIELRRRVVAAYEAGVGSYPEVAERFDVGEASVKRWVRLKRKLGNLVARPKGGGRRSLIGLKDIETALATRPDATALELTAEINRVRHRTRRVHVSSTKRALHRHGFVVKKNADGRWRVCARTSRSSEPSS
jgi:transposase